jgi:hypothetical protein
MSPPRKEGKKKASAEIKGKKPPSVGGVQYSVHALNGGQRLDYAG